jgi:hypothetical protein
MYHLVKYYYSDRIQGIYKQAHVANRLSQVLVDVDDI